MSNKDLPTLKDVSRVPEELLPVLHWWQDRGPKTLAYVLGAVIVIGGLVLWYEQRQSKKASAVVALESASQAEDYEAIVALGTPASTVARLSLAHSLYNAGDYEAALAEYETASKSLNDAALVDIAAVGRICSLEALGRLDEALEAILSLEPTFKASAVPHYLFPELLLAKARILCQKGDKSGAKQTLEPLLAAEEGTDFAKYRSQAERTVSMIDAYVKKSLFEKATAVKTPAVQKPADEAK